MDEENSRMSKEHEHSECKIINRTNGKLGRFLNGLLVVIGLVFLLGPLSYVVCQLVGCLVVQQNLAWTYAALSITPFALALILRGGFPRWVEKRRTVEKAEIEGLYSEIDRYKSYDNKEQVHTEAIKQAEKEREKLEALDRPILELDVLPLRQALVDLYYPEAELIAKTRTELEYLAYAADYDEEVVKDAKRVESLIDKLEEIIKNRADQEKERKEEGVEIERQLRAELKELRDTTTWYEKTWALGEWLLVCITCWVCATVLVTMLVGILPIIHSQGNWNLCILHWAVLGATGALFAALLRLHYNQNLADLGETEGKQILQWTMRHIAIGAITAVLLYAAIWGGALDGKVFPDLPTGQVHYEVSQTELPVGGQDLAADQATQKEVDWDSLKNVGLSLFWAVFAGLSPVVFQRLCRVAESSLGELSAESGEE